MTPAYDNGNQRKAWSVRFFMAQRRILFNSFAFDIFNTFLWMPSQKLLKHIES